MTEYIDGYVVNVTNIGRKYSGGNRSTLHRADCGTVKRSGLRSRGAGLSYLGLFRATVSRLRNERLTVHSCVHESIDDILDRSPYEKGTS